MEICGMWNVCHCAWHGAGISHLGLVLALIWNGGITEGTEDLLPLF
jgi:hypothetical protein